jgi:hypothetical protein
VTDANHNYVSWGRWDATMAEVDRRLGVLESRQELLRGAEQEHRTYEDRINSLEQEIREQSVSLRGRRDRTWLIALTVLSGLILPILTTITIAYLHIRSH